MVRRLLFAWLPLGAAALAWSCGGGHSSPAAPTDASTESGDAAAETSAGDDGGGVPETGPQVRCQLADMTDPVALCTQKIVLKAILDFAIYKKGQGMPATWDSSSLAPGSDHSWQADLALASSIASYHCSSGVYGDDEITPRLDALLPDVGALLATELSTLPADYDGETYFRLRNAQSGLNIVVDLPDANKVGASADAYGAAIQSKYAQTVPAIADGGGAPGVVLGAPANGAVAYEPAKAVMGAAALLDMAVVHAGDADAGSLPAQWQATATAVLDYVARRGRDPVTGLYFDSLVTSGDPGHDALGATDPGILRTDTQAAIVLGLARAQDLLAPLQAQADAGTADGGGLPSMPYAQAANDLVTALNTANLWDGPSDHTSTGPGAFMEGLLPGGAIDTNKSTYGNAFLLGGFHRVAFALGSSFAYEPKQIRAALVQQKPANSSLFSVIQTGLGQVGYLRAGSKAWGLAVDFAPDGGAGGQEQGATLYRTDAMAAMIEGFTQLWRGTTHSSGCAN
jgi:hypothetical protein